MVKEKVNPVDLVLYEPKKNMNPLSLEEVTN